MFTLPSATGSSCACVAKPVTSLVIWSYVPTSPALPHDQLHFVWSARAHGVMSSATRVRVWRPGRVRFT